MAISNMANSAIFVDRDCTVLVQGKKYNWSGRVADSVIEWTNLKCRVVAVNRHTVTVYDYQDRMERTYSALQLQKIQAYFTPRKWYQLW